MRTGARNWSGAASTPKHQLAPRMSLPKARTPEESSSSWLQVTSDSCLEALLEGWLEVRGGSCPPCAYANQTDQLMLLSMHHPVSALSPLKCPKLSARLYPIPATQEPCLLSVKLLLMNLQKTKTKKPSKIALCGLWVKFSEFLRKLKSHWLKVAFFGGCWVFQNLSPS